jgi:hypothetical protein
LEYIAADAKSWRSAAQKQVAPVPWLCDPPLQRTIGDVLEMNKETWGSGNVSDIMAAKSIVLRRENDFDEGIRTYYRG